LSGVGNQAKPEDRVRDWGEIHPLFCDDQVGNNVVDTGGKDRDRGEKREHRVFPVKRE